MTKEFKKGEDVTIRQPQGLASGYIDGQRPNANGDYKVRIIGNETPIWVNPVLIHPKSDKYQI